MTETTTARPWDTADDWSMWEITGTYPTKPGHGKHSFTACLAMVAPRFTHGTDKPLFLFVGPLADINDPVDPTWITDARPLLLVDRDDPTQAYWEHDQAALDDGIGLLTAEPRVWLPGDEVPADVVVYTRDGVQAGPGPDGPWQTGVPVVEVLPTPTATFAAAVAAEQTRRAVTAGAGSPVPAVSERPHGPHATGRVYPDAQAGTGDPSASLECSAPEVRR